jgi:hypothetical protein
MQIKTANGKQVLSITRGEWKAIGKKAGWEDLWEGRETTTEPEDDEFEELDPEEEAYRMLFPEDEDLTPDMPSEDMAFKDEIIAEEAKSAISGLSVLYRTQMDKLDAGYLTPLDTICETILGIVGDYLSEIGIDIDLGTAVEIIAGYLEGDTTSAEDATIKALIQKILAAASKSRSEAAADAVVKTASGRKILRLSREAWHRIGSMKGWLKK